MYAHAFNEARDAYHRWHWERFKEPPAVRAALVEAVRLGPKRGVCPRCGTSRRLGPTTRQSPLALCRGCQRALLPLVPHAERRRGFATVHGYQTAFLLERTGAVVTRSGRVRLPRVDKRSPEGRARQLAASRRAHAKARAADPEGYRAKRNANERKRRAAARAGTAAPADRVAE